MNIETFQNCTENGEIFSCFLKIGAAENMTDCKNRCRSKSLFAFDLDDFYNFADRLNQSNWLVQRKSPQFISSSVESLVEVSRKSKTLTINLITTDLYFEFRHIIFPGNPLSLHQHRF